MGINPSWIITAKITPPPPRSGLIFRSQLIRRLANFHAYRLTLISAPAGYGKTSLISFWLAGQNETVAWLSLDSGDNSPARFFTYLATTLSRACSSIDQSAIEEILAWDEQKSVEELLTYLLQELEKSCTSILLVLDDYHIIKNPLIHQGMLFLIQNLPLGANAACHLVLISRSDPPFPLSRWRLHRELQEIRTRDLQFSVDEVRDFFNNINSHDLSLEQVTFLHKQTEGWVAGLQLAALSINYQEPPEIDCYIRTFSGKNRFISDYLLEEVLLQQPEEIQSFLLKTSILELMSGPLCDAVLEQSNSQSLLETLERCNLFVLALDDQHEWFRYHQLFLEGMAVRQQSLKKHEVEDLHIRAARWYETHGVIEQSINHWVAAGHVSQAARVVTNASGQLLSEGRSLFLKDLIESLPDQAAETWPFLDIYHGWTSHLLGLAQVDNFLNRAELNIAAYQSAFDLEEIQRMEGEIATLRAVISAEMGDFRSTIELADHALSLLPKEATKVRGLTLFSKATAHFARSELDEALQRSIQAGLELRVGGNIGASIDAFELAGDIFVIQGKLHQAAQKYQDMIQPDQKMREKQSTLCCLSYSGLGEILYEWNRPGEALNLLKSGYQLSELQGYSKRGQSAVALGNYFISVGDLDSAEDILSEFHLHVESSPLLPHVQSKLIACFLELSAALHDHRRFERLVASRRLKFDLPLGINREVEGMALAAASLRSGDFRAATDLASLVEMSMHLGGRHGRRVKMLALQAVALHRLGEEKEAIQSLTQALAIGRLEGYRRSFIIWGESMLELLVAFSRSHGRSWPEQVDQDYVNELMHGILNPTAECCQKIPEQPSTTPADITRAVLGESLTAQEINILRSIARGKDNAEIAELHGISINTVKTHTSSIYSKLGVHNRVQAANRANLLGLI